MGKKLRFVFLGIQVATTLLFTGIFIHALFLANAQGELFETLPHLIPSVVHLWVTLVAATLSVYSIGNIGAGSPLPPLLFLPYAWECKNPPLYYQLSIS